MYFIFLQSTFKHHVVTVKDKNEMEVNSIGKSIMGNLNNYQSDIPS